MKDKQYHTNEKLLIRIVNHLILNTSFMKEVGLYRGKMGVVLFFAHYARYTGEFLYNDFAGELIDEIYENSHLGIPIDFENGLCGIAWGIHYLIENGFMAGDPDDILRDIDEKIMERDLMRMKDKSFETGLGGISFYIETRLKGKKESAGNIPFDKDYLDKWRKISIISDTLISKNILHEITKDSSDMEDISTTGLGLKNGCAGVGLKMILG